MSHESLILAYIDPGAGSMMLQVVVAVLIGGFIRFRAFFGRLAASIASLLKPKK